MIYSFGKILGSSLLWKNFLHQWIVVCVEEDLDLIDGTLRRGKIRVPAASHLRKLGNVFGMVSPLVCHDYKFDELLLVHSSFLGVSFEAPGGGLHDIHVLHEIEVVLASVVGQFLDGVLLERSFLGSAVPSVLDFLFGEKGVF